MHDPTPHYIQKLMQAKEGLRKFWYTSLTLGLLTAAAIGYSMKTNDATISNPKEIVTEIKELPQIETLEKKVFIYHQNLSNNEMFDTAMSVTDMWMPHFYDIIQKPIMKDKQFPVYKTIKGKKGKKSQKKLIRYETRPVRVGEETIFEKRSGIEKLSELKDVANKNFKYCLPMVGVFNANSIETVLNNAQEYAKKIATEIKAIGAQGVSLDLESVHYNANSSEKLVEFVKAVRKELPKEQYQIAIAVSPRFEGSAEHGFPHHGFYDFDKLSKEVDYIHLMCYDFNKDKVGPGMPADMLNKVLTYAKTHIPEEKIVPLFPLYGGAWIEKIRTVGKGKKKKNIITLSNLKILSSKNNDTFFTKHPPKIKTYHNGELYIKTKDGRIVYTQDEKTYTDRLATLDKFGIKNSGGWKQTHGSAEIYDAFKNWKRQ